MHVNPFSSMPLDLIPLPGHLIFIQSRYYSKCQVINIFIILQTSPLEEKATIESRADEFLHPLDTHIRHRHQQLWSSPLFLSLSLATVSSIIQSFFLHRVYTSTLHGGGVTGRRAAVSERVSPEGASSSVQRGPRQMKVKGKVERVGGGRGTRRCYLPYKLGPPARSGGPRARDLQSPRVRGTTGPREPRASEIPYGRSPPIKVHVCICRGDVYMYTCERGCVCVCIHCIHTCHNVTYTRVYARIDADFLRQGRRRESIFSPVFSRELLSCDSVRLCDNFSVTTYRTPSRIDLASGILAKAA